MSLDSSCYLTRLACTAFVLLVLSKVITYAIRSIRFALSSVNVDQSLDVISALIACAVSAD
jgi:hypothetical protein